MSVPTCVCVHVGSDMYTCSCHHVWIGVRVRKTPNCKIKSRSTSQYVELNKEHEGEEWGGRREGQIQRMRNRWREIEDGR